MKIAYLSAFYPFRGGIAQFNANLFRVLEKEHEVTPFNFKRQYPGFLFPGKTQYVTASDKADAIESVPVLDSANPFSYAAVARRITAWQPDLLLMRYWMSYFAPSLGYVAGKLRKQCKVVTILDNVIPHEPKFFDAPLTRWFLRRNSGFIAMSESVRSDLLRLRPDAPHILKPHPLYNHFGEKVNPGEARRSLGLDPDKKTLLFFGFIRAYKGLDLLIEAMNRLDEGYQLLIAGESYGSFDRYDAQIRQAKHPGNIRVFNRYIPDSEVPLFFSAADVCILPYKTATQSGITAIAYHFGIPLIATDTGGLKESIGTPGTGLIAPEISAPALAAAIAEFYRNDRERFVQRIEAHKASLSWESFAEALIRFAGTL